MLPISIARTHIRNGLPNFDLVPFAFAAACSDDTALERERLAHQCSSHSLQRIDRSLQIFGADSFD
jgi:hypothetical protein